MVKEGRQSLGIFVFESTNEGFEWRIIPHVPREKPDLGPCLHLSMTEAAIQLRMSFSELKREYLKYGFQCWPGRQIRAINREVAELEKKLPTANLWKYIEAKSSIKALEDKKTKIYEKLNSAPSTPPPDDVTPQQSEASTSK